MKTIIVGCTFGYFITAICFAYTIRKLLKQSLTRKKYQLVHIRKEEQLLLSKSHGKAGHTSQLLLNHYNSLSSYTIFFGWNLYIYPIGKRFYLRPGMISNLCPKKQNTSIKNIDKQSK